MGEPNNQKPLYIQVKDYLLEKIGVMKSGLNRLESEHALAAKLNVSRHTVRQALSSLIKDGIISRWQGKGNFGHPTIMKLPMRIDLTSDFHKLLKNVGLQVEMIIANPEITTPSWTMLNRIPEARGSRIHRFKKYYYLDNKLAIHCNFEIFSQYIKTPPKEGKVEDSFTGFLNEYCDIATTYTIAWMRAGTNSEIAGKFIIDPSTSMLIWDEVILDVLDRKIGYVEIYFNPQIMDLSILCTT